MPVNPSVEPQSRHGQICSPCGGGSKLKFRAIACFTMIFFLAAAVMCGMPVVEFRAHPVRQLASSSMAVVHSGPQQKANSSSSWKPVHVPTQRISWQVNHSTESTRVPEEKSEDRPIYTFHLCNLASVDMKWVFSPVRRSSLPVQSPWLSKRQCHRFSESTLRFEWEDNLRVRCHQVRRNSNHVSECQETQYRYAATNVAYFQCGDGGCGGPYIY
jgi:hypothetical protein